MKTGIRKFFNRRLLTTGLIIVTIGCKSTSYTAAPSYGVDKGDQVFSIAVLPDTQYYTGLKHGGTMEMFEDQVQWIIDNVKKENIKYVVHAGDITDKNTEPEWERAAKTMYKLEAANIPYGMAVGNHDQTPGNQASKGVPNTPFTKYFGKSHFKGKKWFGGAMGDTDNADNHFDLFTAGGDKYIALYLVYNEPKKPTHDPVYEKQTMKWADSILTVYKDHRAIVISHSTLSRINESPSEIRPGTNSNTEMANFTQQGKVVYETAKNHSNVFMMLGGHIAGESYRRDEYNGNVIKTYLADYQSRRSAPYATAKDRNGGNGLMRLMKFNLTKQTLAVTTFAPRANGQMIKEEDGDSQFIHPLFK